MPRKGSKVIHRPKAGPNHKRSSQDVKVRVQTPRGAHDMKPGTAVVKVWKRGNGSVRIGRRTVNLLLDESVDLSTWSDEELMWGVQRDTRGRRPAVLPNVIPMKVYMELARRITTKVQHRFAAELQIAVEHHLDIINGVKRDKKGVKKSADYPAAVRLKAIEMLYERVLGKAPDHVVIHDGEAPWRKMMAAAIVGTEEQALEEEEEGESDATG